MIEKSDVVGEVTLEEMLEYWGYKKRLSICEGCVYENMCWPIVGGSYLSKVMLKICSYDEVKEAIRKLGDMERNRSIFYYAIQGEWWNCDELTKLVFGD